MKNQNIIAAVTLGICVVIASCILSFGLKKLGEDIRAARASISVPRFPDAIELRNGNASFDIRVRQLEDDRPIRVQSK